MARKLRVIVGQGTATEVYQNTRPGDDYDNIIIGPRGLWAGLPNKLKMGQPAHLLTLPGQKPQPYKYASGFTNAGMENFLDVGTYQQQLMELSKSDNKLMATGKELRLQGCMVETIKEYGGGRLVVRTKNPPLKILADQVIVATGIGPQRKPDPKIITGSPATGLGYDQMLEGIDYVNSKKSGRRVAIYGGGATAAWVATEAMDRGVTNLVWIARPGGTGFTGAVLPGNRNAWILWRTERLRVLGEVKQICFLPRKLRPLVRLEVAIHNGPRVSYYVDQFVYSLGGDPKGEGSIRRILHPELVEMLAPVKDHDRVISDSTGVLAWATPMRELIVIGSATYNVETPFFKKQSAPMHELPHGAQVPDGIAMIVSSVSALNNFIPIQQDSDGNVLSSQININTADRNQLAAYLTIFYPDFPPDVVNEVVTRIILARSRKAQGWDPKNLPSSPEGEHARVPTTRREWGLSEKEFEDIIREAEAFIHK